MKDEKKAAHTETLDTNTSILDRMLSGNHPESQVEKRRWIHFVRSKPRYKPHLFGIQSTRDYETAKFFKGAAVIIEYGERVLEYDH